MASVNCSLYLDAMMQIRTFGPTMRGFGVNALDMGGVWRQPDEKSTEGQNASGLTHQIARWRKINRHDFYAEWDDQAAVTRDSQLIFFFQFLQPAGGGRISRAIARATIPATAAAERSPFQNAPHRQSQGTRQAHDAPGSVLAGLRRRLAGAGNHHPPQWLDQGKARHPRA
jgi:hypothetical protein